jgi:hypothetical protein
MNVPDKNKIQEDCDFIIKELEKTHPNPYFFIKPNDFKNSLERFSETIEQGSLRDLYFGLMKEISLIKDSHTRVKGISKVLKSPAYPFRIKILDGNFYISSIHSEINDIIGSKLTSLNGVTISNVKKVFSEILTHENDIVLNNAIEDWIYEPEILEYLGIVDENKSLHIEVDRNKQEIKLTENKADLCTPRAHNIEKTETLKPRGLYWTKVYKDLSTFYLQYNECENISREEIESIIEELVSSESKYIVIDLRNNLGGSSLILDPLTNFLYKHQEKYNPVVLISEKTYSAAIINALNILDGKNAISVGKPTSGSPTKFGQTETIILPNTKIEIAISSKEFKEPGYSFGEPLKPTIETHQTIDQYLKAEDVDWNTFLKHIG